MDCGIPVNPNLARVQTEGGIGQGIGMALYENEMCIRDRKIFWRIRLPMAKPGIISGVTLAFARAIGEYGATSMLEMCIRDSRSPLI